jgi:enterochelin esterase family protein
MIENSLQQNLLRAVLILGILSITLLAAQQPSNEEMIRIAYSGDEAALRAAIEKRHPALAGRAAASVWGQDFLFVASTDKQAELSVDLQPAVPMKRIAGTDLWYALRKLTAGTTHAWQAFAGGAPLGNRADLPAHNPDSYPKPGVPQGKLSGKFTITSRIYNGMRADYWIYASPGVDPARPSALMVWQDGETIARDDGGSTRHFTVIENLVHQRLMPPSVHVLIAPGISPEGRPMRSIEYDTVSDAYPRFLLEEVLPEVEKLYQLRPDGYSRAIGGRSSGAICSFNAAWHFPDKFARVHSTIGSYTSIQWRPEQKLEGGNVYPFKVRKEPKRNIRVWLSDGSDDLENSHGSWPLQNIQMANSLKMMGYDYHFRFDSSAHNSSREAVDLPESLAWLWRGYDASKSAEEFQQDPEEKDKPLYRVRIANRDAW